MSDEELMVDGELENVDLADVLLDRMAEIKADGDDAREQPPDVEETPPEDEPQQEVVSPPPPLVKVVEVDNPQYIAYDPTLRAMMQRFVEDHLNVPSITYETFHAFMCSIVDKIAQAKVMKMPDRDLHARVLIGFVNNVLTGFMLCSMRPNRMPHIATMEVTYIYSEDIHLTNEFVNAIAKYKKLWRAKWVTCIAVNEKVEHTLSRILTGYRMSGYYIHGLGIKQRTVNRVVEAL